MIVLDTGILIYGIQGKKKGLLNAYEQRIVPRAQALLSELASHDSKILIPAPAAWEFVLDFPVEEQPEIRSQMSGFGIPPFDQAAARIAAEIMRKHFDYAMATQKGQGKKDVKKAGARQLLKVDAQIVAIAIAQGATHLYTLETEKFAKWADGTILVKGLPQTQLLLPGIDSDAADKTDG